MEPAKSTAEIFLDKHYKKQGPLKEGESFPPIFYILFPNSKNGLAKISRRRNFGLPNDSFFISYMREGGSTPEEELNYYEFKSSTYIEKASPIRYDLKTGKVRIRFDNIKRELIDPPPEHPNWPKTRHYTDSPPYVIESPVWHRSKLDSALGIGTSALKKTFGGRRRKTRKHRK